MPLRTREQLDPFRLVPRVLSDSQRKRWTPSDIKPLQLAERTQEFLCEVGVPAEPIHACRFRLSEKAWRVSRRTAPGLSDLPFPLRVADIIPSWATLEAHGEICREISLDAQGAVYMVDVSNGWQGVWPSPVRYASINLETFVGQLALVVELMSHPSSFKHDEWVPEYIERFKRELCDLDPDALRDETTYWQDAVEEFEFPI